MATAKSNDRDIQPGRDKIKLPEQLLILDGQFVHNIGELQMNVTNWGFLGSLPNSTHPMADSPSAQWPAGSGVEYLYAAGIWIGAEINGIPYVSTGYPETEFYPDKSPIDIIYRTFEGDRGGNRYPGPANDDGDSRVDEDWLNGRDDDDDGQIDEDFSAIGQQMFSCWYTDDQATATALYPEHTPMNLHVRQETYQWSDGEFDDFVGVRYYVTNQGNRFLTNVCLGIYADVDAGPRIYGNYHMDDRVGFWDGIRCATIGKYDMPVRVKVGYVFDDNGDNGKTRGYFGIVLLGHTTGLFVPSGTIYHRAFRAFQGLLPYASGGKPTNDFERYDALSSPEIDEDQEKPGDYTILLSVGPFGLLPPGGTLVFDIAYVCGEGLEGMLKNAANAAIVHNGYWFDKDRKSSTGKNGRETPIPGKIKAWDPDACDGVEEKLTAEKGEIIWSNIDCAEERWRWSYMNCYARSAYFSNYQTGVDGRETQVFWITDSPPPPPKMRVVPGDNKVTIFWDNLSELVPDVMTGWRDFEGYQIWRADGWHRPIGTTVASGPSTDLWFLYEFRDLINSVPPNIDFKKPFIRGGWQYEPLMNLQDRESLLRMFEETLWQHPLDAVLCPSGLSNEVCDTLEALARYNLGFQGGREYYIFVDDKAINGVPYFYSVVAYDRKRISRKQGEGNLYNSPATNFKFVTPQSNAQVPEKFDKRDVYVVPNPVTEENLEGWRLEPNNSDPTGVKLEFRNLPKCRSTVRIFTIAGDLVQTLYHDGRDGNGSLPWNLLSRNGQDITNGVYLYSVEPWDSRFPRIVGKFVVVR